jgi:hypothetical protein
MENQNFNNPPQQPPQGGFYMMPPLPNSGAVLVLGILSIVLCWTWGIIGLVLGIVALALSGKANTLYQQNPNLYSVASYNNLKAGKICAIIGTILSALFLIIIIIEIIFIGTIATSFPWNDMRHFH